MNKINNVKLLNILPPNLRKDPDIIAASESIDKEYQKIINSISNCKTIVDIDNAQEQVVDHLALEAHADYYEQDLPIKSKRNLAKNAYLYHFTKGTPFAVEQIITDAFSEALVKEWFEYNGEPYTFKIVVNHINAAKARKLLQASNSVKNKRSWLRKINSDLFNLYVDYLDEYNKYTLSLETGTGFVGQWHTECSFFGSKNKILISSFFLKKQNLIFSGGLFSDSENKYSKSMSKYSKIYSKSFIEKQNYFFSSQLTSDYFSGNNNLIEFFKTSFIQKTYYLKNEFIFCNTFQCGEVAA